MPTERAFALFKERLHTRHLDASKHEDGGRDDLHRQGTGNITRASCRCARIIWWIRSPAPDAHSGWEKGQVENQVGLVRERFFTPEVAVRELRRTERLAHRQMYRLRQGASTSRTCRADGVACSRRSGPEKACRLHRGRFDGIPHALPASGVSKNCLVRFDNNKSSVNASAVGRPVELHAYADRIVIRQDGRIVAEHRRSYGRGETIYDPWHYVPVLARKPGALRNGAPFRDWVLPAALERVRRAARRVRTMAIVRWLPSWPPC